MKKNRRKHTQEFKEEPVKLITEQGYQITDATRNLGVNDWADGSVRLKEPEKVYPIALICIVMKVSRSGYYAWRKWGRSSRQKENERL